MRLEMSYAARGLWEEGLRKLDLPITTELGPLGRFEVYKEDQSGQVRLGSLGPEPTPSLTIVGRLSVDPSGMRAEDDVLLTQDSNGEIVQAKAIHCPEISQLDEGAGCVSGAIGFALGVPLETMRAFGTDWSNHFIPEDEGDRRLLTRLGTRRVRLSLVSKGEVEIFRKRNIDQDFIQALASRRIPITYEAVMGSGGPAVRFRALWRVLEYAFQAHGRDLVELLAHFPPTRELGFDEEELDALRTLRGRLSHAASRSGSTELRRADAEAIGSLGRLWSLVDWIVLTKKEPGRSLDVEVLEPLVAYVRRDGAMETVDDEDDPRDLVDWSQASMRFRSPESFL